jgi:hypothetical protein
VSPVQLTDGREGVEGAGVEGAGVEPNHTTARKLGLYDTVPYLDKSFRSFVELTNTKSLNAK